MINNEFTRQWLERITRESDAPVDFGMALPVQRRHRRGHRERGGVAGVRRGLVHHRGDVARRRGLRQQALMARNPAAQTAFGPMVQVAIEQYETPERRLVDDDLALSILPAGQRAIVRAMRLALPAPPDDIGGRAGGGRARGRSSRAANASSMTSLDEALPDIDAVVILGAGMDTRGYRLARRSDIPVFEVDLPVNIDAQEGRRAARDRRGADVGSPGALGL